MHRNGFKLAPYGPQEFQLVKDDNILCIAVSNTAAGTVKIFHGKQKRHFISRKKGLIKTKTLLENEYGVRLASLSPEKSDANSGIINMEENHFHYEFSNKPGKELLIYNNDKFIPVATCGLPVSVSNDKQTANLLLMIFSWYLEVSGKVIQKFHSL